MLQFSLNGDIRYLERKPSADEPVLTLIASKDVEQNIQVPGIEHLLVHTPLARDVRVCKTEPGRNYISGTILTPRRTKDQQEIAFGYLLTQNHIILCDDTDVAHTMIQRMIKGHMSTEEGVGSFFCGFLEMLLSKDLHHLQELETTLNNLEEQILSGSLEEFNLQMTDLRKELYDWIRYYTQLEDFTNELEENRNKYFNSNVLSSLHLISNRVNRLKDESQILREYGLQVWELFQSEIAIRQNNIMKILAIVTTIFLPLTLVVGWYGMNFAHMPELSWKYGYGAVIVFSIVIVIVCIVIMKKKKFW